MDLSNLSTINHLFLRTFQYLRCTKTHLTTMRKPYSLVSHTTHCRTQLTCLLFIFLLFLSLSFMPQHDLSLSLSLSLSLFLLSLSRLIIQSTVLCKMQYLRPVPSTKLRRSCLLISKYCYINANRERK